MSKKRKPRKRKRSERTFSQHSERSHELLLRRLHLSISRSIQALAAKVLGPRSPNQPRSNKQKRSAEHEGRLERAAESDDDIAGHAGRSGNDAVNKRTPTQEATNLLHAHPAPARLRHHPRFEDGEEDAGADAAQKPAQRQREERTEHLGGTGEGVEEAEGEADPFAAVAVCVVPC